MFAADSAPASGGITKYSSSRLENPFLECPSSSLVADRAGDPQLHDAQRPVAIARWRAQTRRDQQRLLLAVEELQIGGATALLPVQRLLETFRYTAPPHIFHGSCIAPVGIRDLPVRPARPVRIHLE